jgi:hypothetical protein
MTSVTVAAAETPFKFCDYYTDSESDRASFGGRDDDIEEVVARIMRGTVSVLYGKSGLGKTSLLLAGVFPEIRKRGVSPVHIRLLESPMGDLADTLTDAFSARCEATAIDILNCLTKVSQEHGVLLVFDQFEEFFLRFRTQVRRAGTAELDKEGQVLVALLGRIVRDKQLDIRILFSLREDYLADLDDLRDEIPELLESSYRIRPLTAYGTRQAIVRPLDNRGVIYSQHLISRLVDAMAAEAFDPLVLQITCSELYREATRRVEERHETKIELTEADLDAVGDVDSVFHRYLLKVINEIKTAYPQLELTTRNVLDAMITEQKTKRAVTIETLTKDVGGQVQDQLTILTFLSQQRLVRRDPRGKTFWYELAHERLVYSILDWFKENKEFNDFRFVRDEITIKSKGEFRARLESLPGKEQIESWRPFWSRLQLGPMEKEFVFSASAYQQMDDVQQRAVGLDDAKVREILQDFYSRKDNEHARRASVWTAGRLPDPTGELGELCRKAVMEDGCEAVRRAAGASLGKLGNGKKISELISLAGAKGSRILAREALADVYEVRHTLPEAGLRLRRKVRKLAEKRILTQHEREIVEHSRKGARFGFFASLIWAVFVLFPWIAATALADGTVPVWFSVQPYVFLALFGVIAGGITGALLGRYIVRRAARRWVLPGEMSWLLVLCRAPAFWYSYFACIALWTLWAFHTYGTQQQVWNQIRAGMMWVALAIAVSWLLVIGSLLLARNTVADGWRGWFWATAHSAGLPILLVILAFRYGAQYYFRTLSAEDFRVMMLVFVPILSLLCLSMSLALANGMEVVWQRNSLPLRYVSGFTGAAGAVAAAVAITSVFGLNSLFLPQGLDLDKDGATLDVVNWNSGPWPLSRYFRLQNRSQDSEWAELDFGRAFTLLCDSGNPVQNHLKVTPGQHLCAVRAVHQTAGAASVGHIKGVSDEQEISVPLVNPRALVSPKLARVELLPDQVDPSDYHKQVVFKVDKDKKASAAITVTFLDQNTHEMLNVEKHSLEHLFNNNVDRFRVPVGDDGRAIAEIRVKRPPDAHSPKKLNVYFDAVSTVTVFSDSRASDLNIRAWNLVQSGNYAAALPLALQAVDAQSEAKDLDTLALQAVDAQFEAKYLDTLAHAAYGVHNYALATVAWDTAFSMGFIVSDPLCLADKQKAEEARRLAGIKK